MWQVGVVKMQNIIYTFNVHCHSMGYFDKLSIKCVDIAPE